MGSELSTPTVVVGGATVAAGIVGAALYAKQHPETPEAASRILTPEKDKGKGKASTGGGRKRKGASSVAASTKRVGGPPPEKKDDTPPALAAQAALFDSAAATDKGHSSAMEDVMASTTSVASKSSRRKRGRKPKASTPTTVERKEVEEEAEEEVEEEEEEEEEATPEPTTATSSSAFGGPSRGSRGHNKFSTLLAESQYVSAKPSMEASWLQVDKTRAAAAAKRRKQQQQQQKASAEVSSDAGFTASATGDDSHSERGQESNSMSALASKIGHVQPKTQVDDMLPPEASISRVMRVQSAPDDDLLHSTDADAEEEGWGIVRRRRASPNTASTPPAEPTPSGDELNKDQRRREARKDATKAAKADAEADRLKKLAQHKKEQEKARIEEMRKKELSAPTKKGKEAKISGGMRAVVQDGKLVWE